MKRYELIPETKPDLIDEASVSGAWPMKNGRVVIRDASRTVNF